MWFDKISPERNLICTVEIFAARGIKMEFFICKIWICVLKNELWWYWLMQLHKQWFIKRFFFFLIWIHVTPWTNDKNRSTHWGWNDLPWIPKETGIYVKRPSRWCLKELLLSPVNTSVLILVTLESRGCLSFYWQLWSQLRQMEDTIRRRKQARPRQLLRRWDAPRWA